MQEEIDLYYEDANESMEKAMAHMQRELSKVRTGKASPAMFDSLLVDYYGSPTPLKQVASIGAQDARTLTIQPWEKGMLAPIEQSIFAANLGVTPQNDGQIIRVVMPMLTEERRRDLVKQVKKLGEEAKVNIRNSRRDLMEILKKAVKDGYPEDLGKREEDKAQKLTDNFTQKVDEMLEAKEKDIMKV